MICFHHGFYWWPNYIPQRVVAHTLFFWLKLICASDNNDLNDNYFLVDKRRAEAEVPTTIEIPLPAHAKALHAAN
jgi:hypothetical protein